MSNLPLVIYLDFDGTIIGDITPQVTEWELVARFAPKHLRAFKASLSSDLEVGNIIRSGFAKMITSIKKTHPNAEFFIYTASDGVWANTVIPCVEAVTGITVNRPILSRKNCLQETYEKSLRMVSPIVYRRLKTSYPDLKTADQVFYNSVLIDNTDVLIAGEKHRNILCPTFDGIYWTDLLRHIPFEVLKRDYVEISMMLRSAGLFPKVSSSHPLSFDEFRMMYYQMLSERIKQQLKDKKKNKSDNLWLVVIKLLTGTSLEKGFSDSTAKYIKKKLASAMHVMNEKRKE